MLILAWMGSHAETDLAKELGSIAPIESRDRRPL